MRKPSSVLATSALIPALATVAFGCGGASSNNLLIGDGGLGPDGTVLIRNEAGMVIGTSGGDGGHLGTTTDGGVTITPVMNDCPNGGTTSVTGKVYDPAGKNPLYNVEVYIPAVPLPTLPKGVPMGAQACTCGALFPSAAYASTSTKVDGTFVLDNVPTGMQKLVLQIGKWRRVVTINVANNCAANPVPDHTLALPGTIPAGDTDDNMPDIAVSTGSADSLECLMLRMGVKGTEYVAGTSAAGHVHVFSGGEPAGGGGGGMACTHSSQCGAGQTCHNGFCGGGGGGGNMIGKRESNPMPGAPESDTSLWATKDQLMPFDILLLSCEGGETYKANPQALEDYLNAGGRAFGSHYHYSWFSGPNLPGGSGQTYQSALPADYGANGSVLGTWTANGTSGGGGSNADIGAQFDLTLNNGSGMPFTKGETMRSWLSEVGALGQGGVPASELSVYQPRYNVVVGPSNPHSQPWLAADQASGNAGQTMYFSFDTPLNAAPNYCGRAVFSDMHVGGDTDVDNDTVNGVGGFGGGGGTGGSPPPAGCDNTELSPQEKALEFMLFDLSSCVTDDSKPVPDAGSVMIPIPK